MKLSKKRMLPIFLVLMLILGLGFSLSVHAATYPTAKRLDKIKTVRRGKTYKFKFRLKSGSYTKRNGIWRAELDCRIYNSSGKIVFWNGEDGLWYSGTLKRSIKWKVPKNMKKGKYRVNYRTYYNKSTSGYNWYYNKKHSTNAWFTIKVK